MTVSAPAASNVATRHVMQANKSKNTKPEKLVRAALREAGLTGYRLHWKAAAGKPDICFPGRRVAIFVHGCYWHRCPHCDLPDPKTHADFWNAKFARNKERDARNRADLVADGWTVIVVWECRLKRDRVQATMRQVVDIVNSCPSGRAGRRAQGEGRVVEAGVGGWQLRVWRERVSRVRR